MAETPSDETARPKTGDMDDSRLAALVRSQIFDAIGYDQTELSLRRVKAIEYYRGELRDLESKEGWSKVTTRDLSDHVGWILPSLMRVFAASDNIVCYEPQGPEDEQSAKQASDYVNYAFWRECNGYQLLWNAFHDGLSFGNGPVKFWWETGEHIEFEDFTGLDDDQFAMVAGDDGVEVLEHSEEANTNIFTDPATGQPTAQAFTSHDIKIKRKTERNCLQVKALPPEEFLLERGATSIEDANFACHRYQRTRQSLIDEGYDRETVMGIGADYDMQSTPEKVARWNRILYDNNHFYSDPLMVEVEVFECYTRVDFDGDGYAEWRKIVLGGLSGSETADHNVLSNEPWSDEVPFADLIPNPNAHMWVGRSLFDELEDVQKVKTTLQRQTLDNLYLSNQPQREVVINRVKNPEEVINPSGPGAPIFVDAIGQIREIATQFVAGESYQMLEYQDQVAEKRTGVSRQSMALDPEALANQTATGQMLAQSASYSKVELFARNIAEIGLKRMFRCILKLLVRYQDKPKMVRLRNQWVQMDPRSWNANMDATVSVGLGSGSRDRDMMMLTQIAAKQEMILQTLGPSNPICDIAMYGNTLGKLAEAAGLRNTEQFFKDVNPQALQQFMQEQQQKAQAPDPKAQAEMARVQMGQQKAAADAQLEQQKAQAQMQLEQQKAQMQFQAEREKGALEMQLMREKAQAEIMVARERAQFEREQKQADALLNAELRKQEMLLEAGITREANAMNAAVASKQADTNIQRQGES